MKKLLLLCLFSFIGCTKNVGREHEILCSDPSNENITTIDITTTGNVVAIVVKGQPVLAYYNDDHKTQLIMLDKNDCVIY